MALRIVNYYNDNDKTSAAWLRELIKRGLIPDGEVDERSISDVKPDDLKGFTQCHFFAGIGGWSEALRLAYWPADRPVWTGSCPCQPFSVAGKGNGKNDERHLWPAFRRLISIKRPDTIFGEQVAGKMGRDWLSDVRFDLENIDYWEGYEKALHGLRKAESIVEISQICGQVIGWVEAFVCGLSKGLRVELALTEQGKVAFNAGKEARKRQEIQDRVYREEHGKISGITNKTKMLEERYSFRPGRSHRGNKPQNRKWNMRIDWTSFKIETREKVMEQPFTGSHKSESWVSILKHQNSLFRHECGSGRLGGEGAENDCALLFGKECINEERIISERFRAVIASSITRCELAGIRLDLEALGYAVGAADLCAACVGAPHIRQRLWWVADNNKERRQDIERRNGQTKQNRREKPSSNIFRPWRRSWASEPNVVRVVHGVSTKVGAGIGCFGNSIVPQVGAEFITGYLLC